MARKIASIVVLCVAVLVMSGCPCTDLHDDVVELRTLHRNWRAMTVAKPEADEAQVERIAENLEETMENMEELTR